MPFSSGVYSQVTSSDFVLLESFGSGGFMRPSEISDPFDYSESFKTPHQPLIEACEPPPAESDFAPGVFLLVDRARFQQRFSQ